MAKTLTEAKIASRAERKRLTPGTHWRGIDPEVHLGYRKGKRGGVWVVRWYLGQRYRQKTLGTADDELHEDTLDFNDAVRAARDLVENERRTARATAAGPLLTVGNAIETYTAARDARHAARMGRHSRSDASSRLSRYVTGKPGFGKRKAVPASPLCEIALHELSERDLLEWGSALPVRLKGTTKQRLKNDLKAALNEAYNTNRDRLPTQLPATIKHGLRGLHTGDDRLDDSAREHLILSDNQVRQVIGAARQIDAEKGWDGDLFRLIVLMAGTGARYSQIIRLRVGDVQRKEQRIIMPASRKGKAGRNCIAPVPVHPDVLEALLPATTGRPNDSPLLERWRSKQVAGGIKWVRDERGPWHSASEITRPWAAIREKAGIPGATPYALRRSSIVRAIKDNKPIRVVAGVHDTSVAMIEKRYGRYTVGGLEELAARNLVPLVPPPTNVVRLTRQ